MSWIFVLSVHTKFFSRIAASCAVGLAFGIILVSDLAHAQDDEPSATLTVFAAASLADVLPDLEKKWTSGNNAPAFRLSIGASAVMARQIEAGARADLFISANRRWVDYLSDRSLINGTPTAVVDNELVFASACSQDTGQTLTLAQLPDVLRRSRFVMADPKVSPAGEYTRNWLIRHSMWAAVENNAVFAGNVRLALLQVERAGMSGFVYRSDVLKSTLACSVMQLQQPSDQQIRYFALVPSTVGTKRQALAQSFVAWLRSAEASDIWLKAGFRPYEP